MKTKKELKEEEWRKTRPEIEYSGRIFVAWAEFSGKTKFFRGTGPEINRWLIVQKRQGAKRIGRKPDEIHDLEN